MRSRVLALFLAVVFGLAGHWPALAGQAPMRVLAVVASVAPDVQPGQDQRRAAELAEVPGPVNAQAEGAAPAPEPEPAHPAEPLGETWSQSLAEGSPDMPALFLADPRAHAPTATMAPPRPHAAAAWRRLYPSVPLRPPRALPAIA
jgi:hypothetical protein